jgi:hypothetical protein
LFRQKLQQLLSFEFHCMPQNCLKHTIRSTALISGAAGVLGCRVASAAASETDATLLNSAAGLAAVAAAACLADHAGIITSNKDTAGCAYSSVFDVLGCFVIVTAARGNK